VSQDDLFCVQYLLNLVLTQIGDFVTLNTNQTKTTVIFRNYFTETLFLILSFFTITSVIICSLVMTCVFFLVLSTRLFVPLFRFIYSVVHLVHFCQHLNRLCSQSNDSQSYLAEYVHRPIVLSASGECAFN